MNILLPHPSAPFLVFKGVAFLLVTLLQVILKPGLLAWHCSSDWDTLHFCGHGEDCSFSYLSPIFQLSFSYLPAPLVNSPLSPGHGPEDSVNASKEGLPPLTSHLTKGLEIHVPKG